MPGSPPGRPRPGSRGPGETPGEQAERRLARHRPAQVAGGHVQLVQIGQQSACHGRPLLPDTAAAPPPMSRRGACWRVSGFDDPLALGVGIVQQRQHRLHLSGQFGGRSAATPARAAEPGAPTDRKRPGSHAPGSRPGQERGSACQGGELGVVALIDAPPRPLGEFLHEVEEVQRVEFERVAEVGIAGERVRVGVGRDLPQDVGDDLRVPVRVSQLLRSSAAGPRWRSRNRPPV